MTQAFLKLHFIGILDISRFLMVTFIFFKKSIKIKLDIKTNAATLKAKPKKPLKKWQNYVAYRCSSSR